MRRRAGAGFLAVLAILAVTGLALRRWEVALAALPAIFFFGAAYLSSPEGRPAPEVRRTIEPGIIPAGSTADVTLEVTNPGMRPAGMIETLDDLPQSAEVTRGVVHHLFTLGPFESKVFRYTVKPSTLGELPLGPLKVRSRDMYHFSFEEGRAGEKGTLLVRRMRQEARKLRLMPSAVHRPFGQVRSRFKGTGTEFFCLRDFVPGDPLRTISWKATARLDRLICREFEDERTGDVVLVVDLRPVVRVGTGTRNTHDAAISGAIAVAEHVLSARNRLALVVVRDAVGVIPGIISRRHLDSLLHREELPDTPVTYPLMHLSWVVRRSLPGRAQVIALTPLIDDFIARTLEEMASAGSRVLVISPSPYSADPVLPPSSPSAAARRLLETRRANRLLRLRRTMQALEWDFTQPLAVSLNKYFRKGGGEQWRLSAGRRRGAF